MSMPLSLSSPFTLNCRRRSQSASSPSPSPAPVSSWRPAHKRAHSSHRDTPALPDTQRCHLDIWRTGKRPRRDISPAQVTRSSTPASADSHTTSSSSSAPHTPLFPASSAELLFPGHSLCRGDLTTRHPRSPSSAVSFPHDDAWESSQSELARLRSAAFSELQRSVQENGEGFVKRMREFEDSRSKSAQHSRTRGTERRRRKRYSPSVPTIRITGKSTVSDDDDDDDDVLIFSNASEPLHSRQKRSSSLGAMDDSDLQSHGKINFSGRLSPVSGIFHPWPFAYRASHVHANATNQSTELSTFSTSFDFTSPHTNAFQPILSHSSSDSFISSADVFLSSSYTEDANDPSSSLMVSPPQSPDYRSAGALLPPASSTEKALAAITLAMASGAGSLEDYEAVRALNISSADESQVGELWH